MKQKDYKHKRTELKNFKTVREEIGFEDSKSRKRFNEDIKRSFRALKRSERQTVKKQIEKELE
jgi:hypothetical protein